MNKSILQSLLQQLSELFLKEFIFSCCMISLRLHVLHVLRCLGLKCFEVFLQLRSGFALVLRFKFFDLLIQQLDLLGCRGRFIGNPLYLFDHGAKSPFKVVQFTGVEILVLTLVLVYGVFRGTVVDSVLRVDDLLG